MALDTSLTVALLSTLSSAMDLATAAVPVDRTKKIRLSTGTGANQADKIFHDQRTLAASATENLDLAGVLVDALGATITFARIKAVVVIAADANTNNVHVIREGTNGVPLFLALGDGIPVHPGGVFAWCAPGATAVPVTGGTGDLLTFTNSGAGTSVTYDVYIIGASA